VYCNKNKSGGGAALGSIIARNWPPFMKYCCTYSHFQRADVFISVRSAAAPWELRELQNLYLCLALTRGPKGLLGNTLKKERRKFIAQNNYYCAE
jgi:hypothetical protein